MNDRLTGADSREQLAPLSLRQIRELRKQAMKPGATSSLPALIPVDRTASAPLSPAQERLWFLESLGTVGATYNIASAFRLQGDLNLSALQRSLAELIRRHESLRTRFESVDGSARQIVDAPTPPVL